MIQLREKERLQKLHLFDTKAFFSALNDDTTLSVRGLNPSTTALPIAQLERYQKRPVVVVAANAQVVEQTAQNAAFFVDRAAQKSTIMPDIQAGIYSGIAQNRRQTAQRIRSLYEICDQNPRIIYTSIASLARRCMPASVLKSNAVLLRCHDCLDIADLETRFLRTGYVKAPEVDTPGTFAIHGGVVDFWSPAHSHAIRVECFGDEIDAIREFDAETQKSRRDRADAVVIPAAEILFDDESVQNAIEHLGAWADQLDMPSKILKKASDAVNERILYWGIQAIMPAFYEKTETLFDYIPKDAIFVWLEPDLCLDTYKNARAQLEAQYKHALDDARLVAPPDDHWVSKEFIVDRIKSHKIVYSGLSFELNSDTAQTFDYDSIDNGDIVAQRKQMSTQRGEDFMKYFAECLSTWMNIYGEVAIIAHHQGAAERIRSLLRPLSVPIQISTRPFDIDTKRESPCDSLTIYIGDLRQGARIPSLHAAIITDSDLFGIKTAQKPKKKTENHALASFKDLKVGDYVVHEDHGIGQYQGLVTLEVGGIVGDFLFITYAESGKLYIPVQRIKSVQKYAGADRPQKLDKLGGGAWERTKEKVRQNVKKLAIDLIDLYAKRMSRAGFAFSERDPFFTAFEACFPYEETPDQAKAIEAVLDDMHAPRPMERLICGDVGFGKTEVAMRAAMRAVLDGKQVAVLVPTTILAEQHYENFLKRFDGHPVTIESLNRFRKPKEIKQILADLEIGKTDILIGTHRILSKDVVFKNLGLLIVDEEHRFGVAHKEKIKALAEGIDCLTMTATPIPRTFQMCLGGIKDISVIETPPNDRLAIHTQVAKISDAIIAQAIEQELARGGQIYFLHNRVEELQEYLDRIMRLVPRVRVAVAHGQMDEKSLEKAMFSFIHHEVDLLLCTTIIESGIDIPSANCLIVAHAERFGLAQLYQIRGRVGRSSERAYCYLLTGEAEISDVARERLAAIERLTELGSGLEIAYLDLEMRGCGNMLGAEQSGNIASVGLDMYAELMQEAVDAIQGTATPMLPEAEVNLPVSANLPESYIDDVQMRLLFYKRLANAETTEQIYDIFGEIIDRYGPPPQEAFNLKDIFELKIMLAQLGVKSMDANYTSIIIDPGENSKLDPAKLVALIASHPKQYAIRSDQKIIRYLSKAESEALPETAAFYLDELRGCTVAG